VEPWPQFLREISRTHGWRKIDGKKVKGGDVKKGTWVWKRKFCHKHFLPDVDACLGDHC